jgi:CheY-like chemotaxis protein
MDLKMPRMDGFDALAWLQGHAAFDALPTVVLSGSGLEEDILKAKARTITKSNLPHATN